MKDTGSSSPVSAAHIANPSLDTSTSCHGAVLEMAAPRAAVPTRTSAEVSRAPSTQQDGAERTRHNVSGPPHVSVTARAAAGDRIGTSSPSANARRLQSVVLGEKDCDTQPRTPSASKRRTRPPSGDGRRRSLPLVQLKSSTTSNASSWSPITAHCAISQSHSNPRLPGETPSPSDQVDCVHRRSRSYGNQSGIADSPRVLKSERIGTADGGGSELREKFETAIASSEEIASSAEGFPLQQRQQKSVELQRTPLDAAQLSSSAGLFAQRRQRSSSERASSSPYLANGTRAAAGQCAAKRRQSLQVEPLVTRTLTSSQQCTRRSPAAVHWERTTTDAEAAQGLCHGTSERSEDVEKEALCNAISVYNQRRQQLDIFKIALCPSNEGVHYEGALRFYYTSPSGQETAKVVRVQNTTSAVDLVPLLLPKFSTCIDKEVRRDPSLFYLAIVDRQGEHRLADDEFPLQISFRSALDAPHRYLLRHLGSSATNDVILSNDVAVSVSAPRTQADTPGADLSTGTTTASSNTSGGSAEAMSRELESATATPTSLTVELAREPSEDGASLATTDSVSDSSSIDQRPTMMTLAARERAPTPTPTPTPSLPSSPAHGTVTPRRLIRTLKRNIRRSTSASATTGTGSRRSWHGDEEQRRRSSSSSTSVRVYAGAGLQERSASDYKTVFACDDTVARDIVDAVLQRLFIYDKSCDDFVLCETIGTVEAYHCVSGEVIEYDGGDVDVSNVTQRFMPRYSRLLAANECPQVLMRLWQVDLSTERRLYIHPCTAVPQYRLGPAQDLSRSGSPRNNPTATTTTTAFGDDLFRRTPSPQQLTFVQRYCDSPSTLRYTGVFADNLTTPFLVTLSCGQPEKHLLVYPLVDKVTAVGRAGTGANLGIPLSGDGVLPLHCTVRCTEVSRTSVASLSQAAGGDTSPLRRHIYSLDPHAGARVAVNGAPVAGLVVLRDGDLIHVADAHAFLFRDSAQPVPVATGWKWLPRPQYSSPSPVTTEPEPKAQVPTNGESLSVKRSPATRSKSVSLPVVTVSSDAHYDSSSSSGIGGGVSSMTKSVRLAFSSAKQEDAFVQIVLTTRDVSSLAAPLSPAATVILVLTGFDTSAVDPSSSNGISGGGVLSVSRKLELKRYLGKVCVALHGVVWQAAAVLDDHKAHLTLDADPLHLLNSMSHDLQELAAWMANVLEVLHALRRLLRSLGINTLGSAGAGQGGGGGGGRGVESADASVDQELAEFAATLQEIVIYAFQQVLYPVTKLLYMVLPAVLDENPFEFMEQSAAHSRGSTSSGGSGHRFHAAGHSSVSDSALGRSFSGSDHSSPSDGDSSSASVYFSSPTRQRDSQHGDNTGKNARHALLKDSQVKHLTDILQTVMDSFSQSQLHPNITLQLLSNIFFFTNASLFNTLMDEGAGDRFYRWNKGIQIRTNLDILESWASQQGVTKEAIRHLQQLSAAADLLALPKQTLLQMSWSQLRAEHKSLTPAQLHRLLQHYQLAGSQRRPIGWLPLSSEMASAQDVDDVLVSFASHPPLRIPTGGYIFALQSIPPLVGITDFMHSVFKHMSEAGYPMTSNTNGSASSSSTTATTTVTRGDGHASSAVITSPITSSPSSASQPGVGDEARRPIAIVTPQMPSPGKKQNGASPAASDAVAKVTTVLDDVCVDEMDAASYGLAAIAEDEEEDGTPQMSRRRRYAAAASEQSKQSQDGSASSGGGSGGAAMTSHGGRMTSPPSSLTTSPPSSLTTSPASTLSRSLSLSTQALHSELVDTDGHDEFVIVSLKKTESGSIGMGLIDGTLMGASPGLYISSLVPGYPAAECGKLREGDKLLAINSCNLSRASQSQAYDVLRSTSRRVTILAIRDAEAAEMIVASSC